ncbi:hypothetical protein HK096_004690, partial [Nowakowskiella sp. JEL0078]
MSQDIPKNVQHNNAQNAILFEAINLSIYLDIQSELVAQAAVILSRFISSKETNMRYLGLETMVNLSGYPETLDTLKKHQETIILSLKDKDISVRRRALDLLYNMCDQFNARTIVSELLHYLMIADFTIREEMVLKIAILTEKFATDNSWFVDVILQLISIAGDQVADEVWYRVVQVVTNNEDLQEYAARTIFNTLQSPTCHENALKVGGYVLGEFGHLIANHAGCGPLEQFNALHSKFRMCGAQTRAMLLTTYLKFVNLFPEIKPEIIKVFKQYLHVLDVDLQQRAFEYLSIISLPSDDLLQAVCEEMPPFTERQSAVLSLIQKATADSIATPIEKRNWQLGGTLKQEVKFDKRRSSILGNRSSVQLLDLSDESSLEQPSHNNAAISETAALASAKAQAKIFYHRLTATPNGILYEDPFLQIGIKTEYQNHIGRLALYFGNKSPSTMTNVVIELSEPDGIVAKLAQAITSSIPAATQVAQIYNIEYLRPVDRVPKLTLEYTISGRPASQLQLDVPVIVTKFLVGVELGAQDFFARWKQLGGSPREKQLVVKIEGVTSENLVQSVKDSLKGLQFALLEGVDPNALNIVAAGIFSSVELGKVGVLVRLEPNLQQQ